MAREAVVGTVHKPQQPEVPEPEDIFRATGIILSDPGLHKVVAWMLSCARASAKLGPAPKVPVEAIRTVVACAVEWRHLEEMANRQTPYAQRCVNEVQRWLSAQEEGGVG